VFRGEGGPGGAVEVLQSPGEGELGEAGGHFQAPLFAARDLGLTAKNQRRAQVQVTPGGLIEQGVELIAQRGALETPQQGHQALVGEIHQPPPAAAS
jgi:hypothetical protein